jgi:hypothetical protein
MSNNVDKICVSFMDSNWKYLQKHLLVFISYYNKLQLIVQLVVYL